MTSASVRTRLRVALRELDPADVAELVQLALALRDDANIPMRDLSTVAGAKNALALLVRTALRGEPITDADIAEIPTLIARIAAR